MARILIATDGSPYSRKAVDYGVALAARIGAEVAGIYVVNLKSLEIYALEHHDNISGYEAENARLEKEGEEALAYLTARCAAARAKAVTRVYRGYPVDEILKAADQERASLIVVGSLGKTNLEHMLLGSVSESVARRARIPVLVVRGNAQL